MHPLRVCRLALAALSLGHAALAAGASTSAQDLAVALAAATAQIATPVNPAG